MIIGAQLYTVRDYCKTLKGISKTLKKIADIGYTTVQLSGLCDYEAEWMAEQLKTNGLSAAITHFDYKRIIENTKATIAFHDILGAKYIGLGSMPDLKARNCSIEVCNEFIENIKPAVEAIYKSGHKFMYHNHHMEFVNLGGRNILDILCENFTPEEFGFILDTYWVQAGGANPELWIHKLKDRANCIHLKDMVYDGASNEVHMAPIGEGNMNYDAIIKACLDTGVEYGYVEQDDCYGADPFECLKISYKYLMSYGLK